MLNHKPIILIVDDQVNDLRILGQALQDLGEVYVATQGSQALEVARQCHPDIVLLDIEMPDMDGYSVCELIKSDPRLCQASVIFVTSHRQTEHELRALRLGGADFLQKPINVPIARARVEAHIKLGEESRRLANYDPLTQLPNRQLLHDRTEQAIRQAAAGQGLVGLLSIDIDHFKVINDTSSHREGDAVLQEIALRLRHCCRLTDTLSRQGGDEFMLLVPELNTVDDLSECAERVMQTIAQPLVIGSSRYDLTASIGISVYPDDSLDAESLLQHADAAAHQAKQAGRGQYRFFDHPTHQRVRARHQLEQEMRTALEQERFEVFYQAKVDLRLQRVVGVEALLRLRDEHGRMISPAEFIPLAEDCGLIVPLGRWVLRQACRAIRQWNEQGHAISVSVNISPLQFSDPQFLDLVKQALAESAIEPRTLELEITEGVLALVDGEHSCDLLSDLKALGVSIAIDDFGTGYSSLAYLKRLPIDVLKIDQSFVRDMVSDPSDGAITRAIIQLGLALGLQLVAEGVETEEQARALSAQGCHVMQGFLYCRPLSYPNMTEYLAVGRLPAQP